MTAIPPTHTDLVHKPAFAHLSTIMPDGSPQTSPVWIDLEDGLLLVNTALNRVKDRNMRRDPRVSVSICDPENPYRAIMVRGTVIDATTEGADAHIDKMAHKYLGAASYPFRQPDEVRVLFRVRPDRVTTMG